MSDLPKEVDATNLWQELVTQNPMLIEITRFRRKFLTFKGAKSSSGVLFILVLICYALLVLIVIENKDAVSPIFLIEFETGLFCLFAPLMLYQSISGERERRSWDLLLAAPITKTQIVVGKFIGAMAALVIAVGFFEAPVLIAAHYSHQFGVIDIAEANLVSVSFVMVVCALTILFSARVKRSLMALGASLGTLMVLLVIYPALIGSGGPDAGRMSDVSLFLNPFHVLERIANFAQTGHIIESSSTSFRPEAPALMGMWWGWPQTLTYLGLTVVLLAWACNTLNFAENEVKFLPQGHKDA